MFSKYLTYVRFDCHSHHKKWPKCQYSCVLLAHMVATDEVVFIVSRRDKRCRTV